LELNNNTFYRNRAIKVGGEINIIEDSYSYRGGAVNIYCPPVFDSTDTDDFEIEIPDKIIYFGRTVEVISNKNIPHTLAPLLLVLTIICLIFDSILFISGFKQKLGTYLLIKFIVQTTFIFHFFLY